MESNTFVRLASINVNGHVEKKGNLSYLSWAWAVDQLLRIDPDAAWEYPEPKMFGATMMVYCTVTAFSRKKTAFLPVMDHRNKPIPNPNAFEVNTAMQRCLVKAIALHGLGLYIYAGEDIPLDESTQGETKGEEKRETNRATNSAKQEAFEAMKPDEQEFLRKIAANVSGLISEDRAYDAYGYWIAQRLDTEEMVAIQHLWDSKERSALTKAAEQWKIENGGKQARGDNHKGANPTERQAA
jgi:hypothetical protein